MQKVEGSSPFSRLQKYLQGHGFLRAYFGQRRPLGADGSVVEALSCIRRPATSRSSPALRPVASGTRTSGTRTAGSLVPDRAIPLEPRSIHSRFGDGLDGRRQIGSTPAGGGAGTTRASCEAAQPPPITLPDEGLDAGRLVPRGWADLPRRPGRSGSHAQRRRLRSRCFCLMARCFRGGNGGRRLVGSTRGGAIGGAPI